MSEEHITPAADDARQQAPETLTTNSWFAVRRYPDAGQEVGPDGQRDYFVIEFERDSVCILAYTRALEVALVRQFRVPVHSWTWELPSGVIADGEDAVTAARRELEEETGLAATSLDYAGSYWTTVGTADQTMHIVFASCERRELLQPPAPDEIDSARWVPLDEALSQCQAEPPATAHTWLALLKFRTWATAG